MDWQTKAAALNALEQISIMIRSPNDWYIQQRTEVGGDGCLTGQYGNGETPERAIIDHWNKLVNDLPSDRYLVVGGSSANRKQYRWNGYMWEDLPN